MDNEFIEKIVEDGRVRFAVGCMTMGESLEPLNAMLLQIIESQNKLKNLSVGQRLLYGKAVQNLVCAIHCAVLGQGLAVIPTLRSSLESICYMYWFDGEPDLEDLWFRRDILEGDEKKKFRKVFSRPVADAANKISGVDAKLSEFVSETYQKTIDFGAHPNINGLAVQSEIYKAKEQHAIYFLGDLHSVQGRMSLYFCQSICHIVASILKLMILDVHTPAMAECIKRHEEHLHMMRDWFLSPFVDSESVI